MPSWDPYAPPRAELEPAPAPDVIEMASRRSRFGAALIDALLLVCCLIPVYGTGRGALLAAGDGGHDPFALFMSGKAGVVAAALTVNAHVINWLLIAWRGQSLGKLVLGIRILRLDGRPAGFLRGVVLRTWLPLALAYAPVVGTWLVCAELLFIFRSDRRCLHDLLAGTKVIKLPG